MDAQIPDKVQRVYQQDTIDPLQISGLELEYPNATRLFFLLSITLFCLTNELENIKL